MCEPKDTWSHEQTGGDVTNIASIESRGPGDEHCLHSKSWHTEHILPSELDASPTLHKCRIQNRLTAESLHIYKYITGSHWITVIWDDHWSIKQDIYMSQTLQCTVASIVPWSQFQETETETETGWCDILHLGQHRTHSSTLWNQVYTMITLLVNTRDVSTTFDILCVCDDHW